MTPTGYALTHQLAEQLRFHWDVAARPRLQGMTDAEYFWEPVPGCWNVRPREQVTTSRHAGSGDFAWEFEYPEPDPAPVTTIAWRLGHLIVGVFAARNHSHFGGPAADIHQFDYAGSAAQALDQLDAVYEHWITAVSGLDEQALARPVGQAEGPFAAEPMITLVLHIHREAIHHLAEVALLRDLYLRQG